MAVWAEFPLPRRRIISKKERKPELSKRMLEVCIDSLESALNAIHGGADELEVCSSLTEGGLTPSAGLVKTITTLVNKILLKRPVYKTCLENCSCLKLVRKPNVNVMIRCRPGSDFCYTDEEIDTMLADIEVFKTMKGVDRFVFGALTNTQQVDKANCMKVLKLASKPVTFHRAIDVCRDYRDSIDDIIELGFDRVLTSGRKASADDKDAFNIIKAIVEECGEQIVIMPGAGINANNSKSFIDVGCKIVHSSAKRIRYLNKVDNNLSMGTGDGEQIFVSDENIVRQIKTVINK